MLHVMPPPGFAEKKLLTAEAAVDSHTNMHKLPMLLCPRDSQLTSLSVIPMAQLLLVL
jgi:hypothetical protein